MHNSPLRLARNVLILALITGCAANGPTLGGDKAGGLPAGGPVILRLASTSGLLSDVPPVAYFVRRVEQLSHGSIEIRVVGAWGNFAPDAEARVVRAVASGTADLGWAGSRVLDTLGVPAFKVLSAPMLIDSYPLERAVLASSIPARLLPLMRRLGVTGLALLGEDLRFPIGVAHALLTTADWHDIGFGTLRSGIQEHAIAALGAHPVEAFGATRTVAIEERRIAGFELDVRRLYVDVGAGTARYVSANVHLWPQFDVLVANPARLSQLSARQRGWLQEAAVDAMQSSVALAQDSAERYVLDACRLGARFAFATNADLASMQRAFSPIYRQLADDQATSASLATIERLRRSTPAGPPPAIPARCQLAP